MADWSIDTPCCVMTWITLALLDQSTKAFPASGTVPMRRLAFWAGSDELRAVRAKTLAIQVIATFVEVAKAVYENGNTQANRKAALEAVQAALLEGDSSMADLAERSNEHFLFLGEAP